MVGTLHRYNTNEATGKLMCPYCSDYEALKQSTMSEHVRQKHAKIANRPIVMALCPHAECGRTFNNKSLLRNHLASKAHFLQEQEPQDQPITMFSCEKCNARFSKKGQLIVHFARSHLPNDAMVTHIDEEHSKCGHCSKVLKKKCPMMYHIGICNPASPFSKEFRGQAQAQAQAQKPLRAGLIKELILQRISQQILMSIIRKHVDLRTITLRAL
jgi:uncharacterized protein YlaI